MANILDALIAIKNTDLLLPNGDKGNNIQLVGSGLENFIKDVFAQVIVGHGSVGKRKKLYNKAFSYAGNSNNPPDIILRDGDAIEVKKVDSLKASIQLNSSPPKSKLLASDTRINSKCRQIALDEGWTEKDIFYAIGSADANHTLKRLWFVYGDCFAANHEVYEKAAQRVTDAISESFEETELVKTNELSGIPNIDPLNITHLRVRGMWIIKSPAVVFSDIVPDLNKNAHFRAYCLMLKSKYLSFPKESRSGFEHVLDDKMVMSNVEIQNPDNPAELLEASLISYEV